MAEPKHTVEQLAGKYVLQSEEVALFIDEAGDRRLKDPNNRLFILAACIALGGSMDKVASDWGDVREALGGDRNKPIHFKDCHRRLRNHRHQKKLCDFFDSADVGRLAVGLVEKNGIDLSSFHGMIVARTVFDELLYQEANLIKRPFTKLVIFFEDSPTMKPIYELCKDLRLKRGDDLYVSLTFRWTTKGTNAPWMEMADGIAHTWAGKVRADPRGDFDSRHRAIFAPTNGAPAMAEKLTAAFSQPSRDAVRIEFERSAWYFGRGWSIV